MGSLGMSGPGMAGVGTGSVGMGSVGRRGPGVGGVAVGVAVVRGGRVAAERVRGSGVGSFGVGDGLVGRGYSLPRRGVGALRGPADGAQRGQTVALGSLGRLLLAARGRLRRLVRREPAARATTP